MNNIQFTQYTTPLLKACFEEYFIDKLFDGIIIGIQDNIKPNIKYSTILMIGLDFNEFLRQYKQYLNDNYSKESIDLTAFNILSDWFLIFIDSSIIAESFQASLNEMIRTPYSKSNLIYESLIQQFYYDLKIPFGQIKETIDSYIKSVTGDSILSKDFSTILNIINSKYDPNWIH